MKSRACECQLARRMRSKSALVGVGSCGVSDCSLLTSFVVVLGPRSNYDEYVVYAEAAVLPFVVVEYEFQKL